MPASDSYGEAFGNRLNAQATSFVTRSLPKTTIAVTELRYDDPQFVPSTPPAEEDAFLIGVHLELYEQYTYWECGKPAPVSTLRPGDAIIYDVKRTPTFLLNNPFHSVHFYLPRGALDAIADEAEAPRIDELRYRPAVSHADPVLRGIAEALLPLFRNPERSTPFFMDHLLLAVGHHVATTYGGMIAGTRPVTGGLSFAQERRAKEMMMANLAGDLRLVDLARECGLSASQFSRAFRRTTGMPPHRWMVQQRIDLAKTLLSQTDTSLAEIALTSGFSDQSHFTRCFSAWTGASPGLWRRSVRDENGVLNEGFLRRF